MKIYQVDDETFTNLLHGNRSIPIFDKNMQKGDTLYAFHGYFINARINKMSRNHDTMKTLPAIRFQPTNYQLQSIYKAWMNKT